MVLKGTVDDALGILVDLDGDGPEEVVDGHPGVVTPGLGVHVSARTTRPQK